jgi:hypothetical protein
MYEEVKVRVWWQHALIPLTLVAGRTGADESSGISRADAAPGRIKHSLTDIKNMNIVLVTHGRVERCEQRHAADKESE